MGTGDEKLGRTLMKGFLYALTQQDTPPGTVLFYNGGAFLTCEGSPRAGGSSGAGGGGRPHPDLRHLSGFLRADRPASGGDGHQYVRHVETLTSADLVVRP